jgi:putative FmdB family regulatory protein
VKVIAMPLYVYACPTCDVLLEELRPIDMADFPPVECPVCHGLCEREVTLFNINRGVTADARVAPVVAGDDVDAPDAVNVLHEPGCPCCRRAS